MSKMEIIHENRPSQFFVLSDGTIYQLKWDDSRLTTHTKDISKTDFEAYLTGDRTGSDLMFKASYGTWPLPRAEQEEAERVFIRETPIAIALFKKAELESLIPIAGKEWIDWKGKLPENYTRPILD